MNEALPTAKITMKRSEKNLWSFVSHVMITIIIRVMITITIRCVSCAMPHHAKRVTRRAMFIQKFRAVPKCSTFSTSSDFSALCYVLTHLVAPRQAQADREIAAPCRSGSQQRRGSPLRGALLAATISSTLSRPTTVSHDRPGRPGPATGGPARREPSRQRPEARREPSRQQPERSPKRSSGEHVDWGLCCEVMS
jgi:hypothetical protein